MNHMNEILQLLDNIIVCGESMAKIGRLLKEFIPEFAEAIPQKTKAEQVIEADTAPAALPEKKEEPAAKTYTFADVRKAFSAKSHSFCGCDTLHPSPGRLELRNVQSGCKSPSQL